MSTRETVHILHHTLRRGGGMEQYALVLAATLRELGHRVVFHAHDVDDCLAREIGAEVERVPVSRLPRKLRDWRYFRALSRQTGSARGIQIALSRVPSANLVICGGTHRGYLKRARKIKGPFDLLQIWMEREAYRRAGLVVSHSDLCRDELVRLYRVPQDKVIVLYPPIDSRFRRPADETERQRTRRELGFPQDKIVFLFPSMGHRRKGLNPICRALEGFSDRVLLAVAGRPSGMRAWSFVRELGFVADMAPLYRAADYSVLASFYEPFGLVGPESVLSGTRLVFEENIGCLSAIDPGAVFKFSVWKPGSIRAAVEQALALAARQEHRIERPDLMLRYDPAPAKHVLALLQHGHATY